MFDVLVKEYLDISNKNQLLSLINGFEDGKWRYLAFQEYIFNNIALTALTAKERESLAGKSHSLQVAAARNLKLTDETDLIGEGSELAEIVLYGIMNDYYDALSIVPKIFYKQNAQDNAKGSDSVHIVLEGDDDFSLWIGEAKFYNSIEDARFTSVITSVHTALNTEKLKKENSIITNLPELGASIDNPDLRDKILSILSQNASLDDVKPRLHIPILLLHECTLTNACIEISQSYRDNLLSHHRERATSYFKKQLAKVKDIFKVGDITFHVILFPVPSKENVVRRFVKAVKFYKEEIK